MDLEKVQAIRDMPTPQTEKQICSFLGKVNYIACFIAQLTFTCDTLFMLLKKDSKIEWTNECQAAFDKIKPPALVPLMPGYSLILCLAVQETSMGCMSGQVAKPDQKEMAIYYLSKKFTNCEINYIAIEKTCCALAWVSHKLR